MREQPAAPAWPDTERIFFALSAAERAQAFPSMDAGAASLPQCHFLDGEGWMPPEEWRRMLERVRPTILVSWWTTPPIPLDLVADGTIPLRYVCHVGGSVKTVVPREFIAAGGLVSNWGNLISHTVAEHTLLLILASLRNLPCWYPAPGGAHRSLWGNAAKFKTRSLRGRTVGIHGFGRIARELVALLKPFDVECQAYSLNVPALFMAEHGVAQAGSLKELFAENDIVIECEALTSETVGAVTLEHFKLMAPDSVFVNVARGAIVDEQAMGVMAAEGHIRMAADVFNTEPLPDNSPLRGKSNVIISPHIAGPTSDWYPHCGDYALQNIERYLAAKPVESVVTLDIYDRTT